MHCLANRMRDSTAGGKSSRKKLNKTKTLSLRLGALNYLSGIVVRSKLANSWN